MGLISCSVFKEKILDGSKPHTIRARKIPPEIGENLYLWWKPRTKEKEFLGVTVCTQVDSIVINPEWNAVLINEDPLSNPAIATLAKNDGFDSLNDFWDFFNKETIGYLIHWNPKFINRSQLRPEVVKHAQLSSDSVGPDCKNYNPSNGTEGMDFLSYWCEECDRDKNTDCEVLLQASFDRTPHWIQHEGQGICTAFVPLGKRSKSTIEQARVRSRERKGQINLLS